AITTRAQHERLCRNQMSLRSIFLPAMILPFRLSGSSFCILLFCLAVLRGSAEPALKEAFKDTFLVGAALSQDQFSGSGGCAIELIPRQFNSITPENILKWERVHPSP